MSSSGQDDGTAAANGVADEPPATDASGAEETPLPFIDRTPWKYLVPIAIIAGLWIAIGLVCSPTDFRF
jgi:hypothetical protein